MELDPVSQIVGLNLGNTLHHAGRVTEGIEQLRRTINLDPQWPSGWKALSEALLEAGEFEAAREAILEFALLNPAAEYAIEEAWVEAAIGYLETGEPQELRLPDGYESLLALPRRYAWTGQPRPTLEALEAAAAAGILKSVGWFHSTRHADLLGDDPRYQALLEEAGITW